MKASLLKIAFSVTFGIGISIGLVLALAQTQMVGYAAGEALCVVPPGDLTGPFPDCQSVFTSVQDAVDTAVSNQQIWIATGVYTDIHSRNNVTQVVYLDKSVTLQGGYEIPFDASSNPETNPTTLDAAENGRVIYVVEGQNVTLAGLNLINGDATDLGGKANAPNGWGGGVFAISATLTISQSTIADNVAEMRDRDGTDGGFGGGVAVRNGELFLYDSTIQNNLAAQYDLGVGGGIAIENSDFHIENNVILSNTAVFTYVTKGDGFGSGGGIAASDSDGSIINNQIGWNIATQAGRAGIGGGISYENEVDRSLTIYNNDIFQNIAHVISTVQNIYDYSYGWGGGISIYNPYDVNPILTATISHNMVHHNVGTVSGNEAYGGGIAIINPQESGDATEGFVRLSFKENQVVQNYASKSMDASGYGLGGGVVFGGVAGSLENNVFISNTTSISGNGYGGAIYFSSGNVHSKNDIIRDNGSDGISPSGTIIFSENALVTMTNAVVMDNVNAPDGAAIRGYGGNLSLIHPTIARNAGASALHLESDLYANTSTSISITNGLLVSQTVGVRVEDNNTLFVNGIMWHEVDTAVSQSLLANVNIQNPSVGDPMFAPDGYHLTEDSEARFAGVPVALTYDVDSQGRPSSNPSFGADEYWLTQQYLPLVFKLN